VRADGLPGSDLAGEQAGLILGEIRAPRTLGAWLVGALLGLAGALAQGLFRNPLADPYLLGAAAGAGLAVVLVLAGASLGGLQLSLDRWRWLEQVGL
jgi:iron complex transport system permease protein